VLSEIFVGLGYKDLGFNKGMKTAQKTLKQVGSDMRKVGLGMSAVFTAPAIAAVGGLLHIAKEWDDVLDTLQTDTGATGKELESLGQSVQNVFKTIPADMQDVANAVSLISQKTGDTGPQLELIATQLLELSRITETDLGTNISATTELFDQWQISTEKQASTLDLLFKASQLTGVPVADLANSLDKYGPILRSFGFGLEESTALLANLGQAGVDPANVITGLRTAFVGFSKAGVTDTNKALGDVFNTIKNSKTDVEAAGIGLETFGSRAGIQMANLIRNGTLSYQDLLALMEGSDSTILDTAEATNDLSENFKVFKNRIKVDLIPVATRLFNYLNKRGIPILEGLATKFETVVKFFSDLPKPVLILVGVFGVFLAAIGPVLIVAGALAGAIAGIVGFIGLFAAAVPAVGTAAAVAAGPLAGLGATLGALVLPLLLIIGVVVILAIAWKKNWFDIQGKTRAAIAFILKTLDPFISKFLKATKTIRKGLSMIADAFKQGGIKGALHALFGDAGKIILKGLGRILGLPTRIIGQFLREIKTGFAPLDAILHNLGAMFQDVGLIIQALFSGQWRKALSLGWDLVKRYLKQFMLIGALLLAVFDAIPWGDIASSLWKGAKSAFNFLWDTGGPWVLSKASTLLGKVLKGFGEKWDSDIHPWVKSLPGRIADLISAGSKLVWNSGTKLIQGLYDGLSTWWNSYVMPLVSWFASWIVSPFANLYNSMYSVGANLIQGLYDGITDWWNRYLKPLIDWVANAIPSWFNLNWISHSPSKVFAGIGKSAMQGLGLGFAKELPSVLSRVKAITSRVSDAATGIAGSAQLSPMSAIGGGNRGIGGLAAGSGAMGGSGSAVFQRGAIVVMSQPGQNEERIAEMTAQKIVRKIRTVQAGAV